MDEKKIVINSRWDDKWVDFQDGGSAEIYQLYKYVADDGDVLACIYWGIAPELDCDMSRDNVMTSWKRLYGKVDVYEYKLVTGSIFSTCAEMEMKMFIRFHIMCNDGRLTIGMWVRDT